MKPQGRNRRLTPWTLLCLGWFFTGLLAYSGGRLQRPTAVEPTAAEPAHQETSVAMVVDHPAPEPTAADWQAMRPDVALGPNFDVRRQAVLRRWYDERQRYGTSLMPERFAEFFWAGLARDQFPLAWRFLQQQEGYLDDGNVYAVFVGYWMQQDEVSAMAALQEVPTEDTYYVCTSILANKFDTIGFERTLDWAQAHGDLFTYAEVRLWSYHSQLDEFAEAGQLSEVNRWLERIAQGGSAQWETLAQDIAGQISGALTRSPEKLVEFYETMPIEPNDTVHVNLAVALSATDPERAWQVLEMCRSRYVIHEGIKKVFRAQAERDPSVLMEWVLRLPNHQIDTYRLALEAYVSVDPVGSFDAARKLTRDQLLDAETFVREFAGSMVIARHIEYAQFLDLQAELQAEGPTGEYLAKELSGVMQEQFRRRVFVAAFNAERLDSAELDEMWDTFYALDAADKTEVQRIILEETSGNPRLAASVLTLPDLLTPEQRATLEQIANPTPQE